MPKPSAKSRVKPIVLCVEDNETYLRLRKAVLEDAGYSVLSASDPSEALKTFRETPVCMVISDHMLRGTTGTDLAKQMKEWKPDVPIVLYSGRVPDKMKNIDCFINKDEPVSAFLKLIGDLLKRSTS